MRLLTKMYIGLVVAAIFTIGILGGAAWSDHKIQKLEDAVANEKHKASVREQSADSLERKATEYKQKTEYLEQQLTEVRKTARKQDEQMEKLDINSRDARIRVARTRNTRSITVSDGTEDLCRKLAEAGHSCEP